jgi:hypothetical protein
MVGGFDEEGGWLLMYLKMRVRCGSGVVGLRNGWRGDCLFVFGCG